MLTKILSNIERLIETLEREIRRSNTAYIAAFKQQLSTMRGLGDTYSLPLGPLSNIHTVSIDSPDQSCHLSFEGIDAKTNPFLDPDYDHPVGAIAHDLVSLFDRNQVRCCQSITKSFVGYTFIKELDAYNLQHASDPILLTDSISKLVGPNPKTHEPFECSFQDVLNMTTGIRWKKGTDLENAEFTDPNHPLRQMLATDNPFQFVLDKMTDGCDPGNFEYSAAMSVFLSTCIEKLSSLRGAGDRPYHDVVNEKVGADMPWYTWPKSGLAAPSSGAHLSHEELYAFTKGLADDTAFLRHLLNTRVCAEGKPEGFCYSSQFWVVELNRQSSSGEPINCFEIAMFGNGGQRASVIVEDLGEELKVHGTYLVQAGDYSSKSLTRFFPEAPLLDQYVLPYLGLFPRS